MRRVRKSWAAVARGGVKLPIDQLIAISLLLIVGCQSKDSGSTTIASSESAMSTGGRTIRETPAEKPVVGEKNPPGAISKSASFVSYKSTVGGYQLDVPRGWSSSENGPDVTFTNAYDGLNVAISSSNSAPTPASVRDNEARLIRAQGRAVKIGAVKSVKLPGGPAVEIDYTSNSEPDSSNRSVRLANTAFLFFRNGTVGWVTWWAPVGAEVSALGRVARSFRWI